MTTRCCLNCKRKFIPRNTQIRDGKGRFCSARCSYQYHHVTRTCLTCGKSFECLRGRINEGSGKYCSYKCHHESLKKRHEVLCDWCQNNLQIIPFELKENKHHFCNHKCYWTWLASNKNSYRNKNPNSVIMLICEWCKKPFKRVRNAIKLVKFHFCSKTCYWEWKRSPRHYYVWKNHPRWRGGYKYYYGPNWFRQRKRALCRDRYLCVMCGGGNKHTETPDVHHIIPFEIFGITNYKKANTLTNLVTLCRKCHKKVEHNPSKLKIKHRLLKPRPINNAILCIK